MLNEKFLPTIPRSYFIYDTTGSKCTIDMSSTIGFDTDSQSELTTLESEDTPTVLNDESPTIQALLTACDDAAYSLIVARIPREHRLKLHGIHYIRYEPYRSKKSKRSAWYWHPTQGEELIQTSQGIQALSGSYGKLLFY